MGKPMTLRLMAALTVVLCVFFGAQTTVYANSNTLIPGIEANISIGGADEPAEIVTSVQTLFLVTLITLAPYILMLLTGFSRIVISMHFLRAAMGTQQMPPNQVIIGVSLVLTIYLMSPVFGTINETAIQPLGEGTVTLEQAFENGMAPLRKFMRDQTELKDAQLFADLSGGETYASVDDAPDSVLIPAFVLGELTKGFMIGFILYLPFIVIDMVVASVLMAMGMMMLPPAMISMPFKILLFLLAGGWSFVIEYVMRTFRVT